MVSLKRNCKRKKVMCQCCGKILKPSFPKVCQIDFAKQAHKYSTHTFANNTFSTLHFPQNSVRVYRGGQGSIKNVMSH